MCSAAEVRGAPRMSPTIPNRQPAPIVTMRTTNGLRSSVEPKAMGWTTFWRRPFGDYGRHP
jgi:hypothetical protein